MARAPKTTESAPEKEAQASATKHSITVPTLELKRAVITVKGLSPLIMHAWNTKAIRAMEDKRGGKAVKKREMKNPEDDFNAARYLDDEQHDCIPAISFKASAVEAGVLAEIPKTTLRKAFFVLGDLLRIKHSAKLPRMRRDMARVGQGTADIRYRPEYSDWSVDVPIEFNARVISLEQIVNLFNNAGYSVGVGEWRPLSKKSSGQFGRFQVVKASEMRA